MKTRIFLLFAYVLVVIAVAACNAASVASPTNPPPSATPVLPTATALPPTETPALPTATPLPLTSPNFMGDGDYFAAYNVGIKRVVLVNNHSTDVWAYDVTEKQWTRLADRPAGALDNMVYADKPDRVIAYSGVRGETWALDVQNDTWQELKSGPFWGESNFISPMAYDSESDKVVLLFGDSEHPETYLFDYNANTWTKMQPAEMPPYSGLPMTYDSVSDRVILWDAVVVKRLWAYDANADAWEMIPYTKGPRVGGYGACAYVPELDRVFEFFLDQFYAFDYNTKQWEQAKGELKPGARMMASMVYDPVARRIVLFGGRNENWGMIDNAVWFYDPQTGEWTQAQ